MAQDPMEQHDWHEEVRKVMDSRPDLAPMSLDEWLIEHHDKLSIDERQRGTALLSEFSGYGGDA